MLVYEVLPPSTAKGDVAFAGAASFDGKSIVIGGRRTAKPGSQLANVRSNSQGQIEINLLGELGAKYSIEASSELVVWEHLTTVVNEIGSVTFSDPSAAKHENRFYRASRVD